MFITWGAEVVTPHRAPFFFFFISFVSPKLAWTQRSSLKCPGDWKFWEFCWPIKPFHSHLTSLEISSVSWADPANITMSPCFWKTLEKQTLKNRGNLLLAANPIGVSKLWWQRATVFHWCFSTSEGRRWAKGDVWLKCFVFFSFHPVVVQQLSWLINTAPLVWRIKPGGVAASNCIPLG